MSKPTNSKSRLSVNIANMDQDRLQGWLNVANAIETDSLDQLEWQRRYVVLAKDERKLYFFNDTESVLMSSPLSPVRFKFDDQDGQGQSSQRKNALTLIDPGFNNFQRGTRATRSFRDKVKSSLQKSVKKNSKQENFAGGSVRVGRSKSFGKMDRIDLTPIVPGMKLGSSLDNIHRVGSHGTAETHYNSLGEHGTFLDLAMRAMLSIQIVHESVSPRHSCFRIITDSDILYASCGSKEELNRWITKLLECQRPNRDHLRRLDTQLTVWILEARNLQPKKRYYCEIYLNGILYALTCCKMMNEILFWGEPFVFEDLPMLGAVMIKLYRENYNKKKREKAPAAELGKIEIPALVLESGQLFEKWYPVMTYQKGVSGVSKDKERETPSARIKLQYQVVSILPLRAYEDFIRFLKTDYSVICEVLEPIISAKAKDEIAQTLVRILQVCGRAKEFLCDVIMAEVQHIENENLIFRGNTFATKAVDTYMKLVGETYLRETLSGFILVTLETEEDCEVDPMKLQPGANLAYNQQVLTALVQRAWFDILSSFTKFPSDLRNTLHGIRQRFGSEREEACFKLISGSIFLRFLCPAILSPSLFQLCQEYPDEKTSRKLTLVAKVIQNLANFTRFGAKEEYMCFMNDFVGKEISNMKGLIRKISSPLSEADAVVEWGPCRIDLGREVSVMHTTLSSQLKSIQLSEVAFRRIEPLPAILDQLSKLAEEEEGDPFSSTFEALRVMQTTISKFNGGGSPEREVSDTSSEYTTPAQSQSTSPTHEHSPPAPSPPNPSDIASLGSMLGFPPSDQTTITVSPCTSPTYGSAVSRLATHSFTASRSGEESSGSWTRTSPPTQPRNQYTGDPGSPRRLSDSELHQHGVKSRLPPSHLQPSHGHSKSIDATFRFDEHIEMAELRVENAHLLEEVEQLKRELERQRGVNERLRGDLGKVDENRKNVDHELKSLRENKGKILRGLNTQTEIALVQFKRDFEYLKKQLQAKDEIISIQERRIVSLTEANCTLRSGLQELQGLPKHEDSDSDLEDEARRMLNSYQSDGSKPLTNGHPPSSHGRHSHTGVVAQHSGATGQGSELMRVISQLDSGRFDI